ncbi:MAG: hybrid sensor histidine kinase/response regulator, partial [Ignavibacteriales bacterium]|nr:hybrid sensor histidine kinase/response regulator [Ignavibacteriales bacterium]
VGISRDITERKDLQARVQDSLSALQASRESLSQLNAQKDRLFSVLSHDLRSPFTSILGFCEILITDGETISDTERKEFLTYIRDAAQRQLALLNRLLDWSRLETGRIKLDIQEIELDSLVKSCLTTHLGTSKQKEITLRSTLPVMTKIRGDQVLLMQVFNNLFSNALKFTPKGGMISIDLVEERDEEWVLAVKDTGSGIPKDDLKKLFKVEEKYTRPGLNGEQGTGLGLSLVYEIVRQHNGSISVDSELGQGTTFTIRLPRVVENKEHVVLVVDDDEGVRVLHSRYLKKMYPDAHVMQASNGKEAFSLAKQYKPRIIVTDYSMPEMNGYEFLNLLKGDPTTKPIPVFVITGKGSTASSDTLLMSGAAAVMDKPVPSKTLQETIEKVLAEKI